MSEELKGKNLFEYNGIINTDNIPKNMFISITKEQYIEYMQQKETIEQQQKEIEELKENISAFTDKKLKNIINNQQKEIEELKKELKRQGNVREIEEEFIEKNYISKNKIKEIIEKHYPDVAITKLNELLEE